MDFEVTPSDVYLKVKRLAVPFPLAAKRRERINPHLEIDVNWSPDSQAITFVWRKPVSKETILRVADGNGKTLKEIVLTRSADLYAQIDSWSADSRFFTVLTQPSQALYSGANINVRIFAAPDLKEVTPPGLSPILGSSCAWTSLYWQVYCTNWTSMGHQVAFVTKTKDDLRIVIATPDNPAVKSYHEPSLQKGATWHDWFLLWSPDNKRIAVVTGKEQHENNSGLVTQLKIYSADGSAQMALGEISYNAMFHADGREDVPWAWAADNNTLFYVRDSQSNEKNFDVVGYSFTSKETTVLFSFPYFGTLAVIYPSSDNQSIFVGIYEFEKTSFYLISSKGKQLWTQIFDKNFMLEYRQLSPWSPRNSYFGILNGYNLEIYGSDGRLVMTRKDDAEVGFVGYIGWIDCG